MRKEILDIIQEQRKKHNHDSDSELLNFAIQQIQDQISCQIIDAGQDLRDAARKLEMLGASSQLIGFSIHLMGAAETIVQEEKEKKPTDILKRYLDTIQFKKLILEMPNKKIMNLLTEDAKQTYFKGE